MHILFAKSKWERPDLTLCEFLDQVAIDGFGCTEYCVAGESTAPQEVRRRHEERGLRMIAQLHTSGKDAAGHLASLDALFAKAAAGGAFRVNLHTGSDFFSVADNVRLFERAEKLSSEYRISVSHETHRGRALFCAPVTREYLERLPFLRLTADFSHWMAVHESDLSDQEETLRAVVGRCDQVHARVGFSQGPQLPDPFAPEWADWLERHLGLWRAIVTRAAAEGKTELAITPEAGPPPYMPALPWTRQPVADAWDLNRRMMRYLTTALAEGL